MTDHLETPDVDAVDSPCPAVETEISLGFHQLLLDRSALSLRDGSGGYWTSGTIFDTSDEGKLHKVGSFASIDANNDPDPAEFQIVFADLDGRSVLQISPLDRSIISRLAEWRAHRGLPLEFPPRRCYLVSDGSNRLGRVVPYFGLLRSKLTMRLIVGSESIRLRQQRARTHWNRDHSYLELIYDIGRRAKRRGTITARWAYAATDAPIDLVVVTNDDISVATRAVVLASMVLIPQVVSFGLAGSGQGVPLGP